MAKPTVHIRVDSSACKRCGLCVAFCAREVFTEGPGGLPGVARPERCTNCRLCDLRCPDYAITLEVSDLA